MEEGKRKKITAGGIAGFAIAFIISYFAVSYFTGKGDDCTFKNLRKDE
ncbi:hypothetical protein [Flavobacterium psychrotrophum]|nr:hypothetical protein [Flavobacterium psychrotrophum]